MGGHTHKNFGLIFINSREFLKKSIFPNTFFLKSICNLSFKKVVIIHEIIFNYCSCILRGNNISFKLTVSQDNFIDYRPI